MLLPYLHATSFIPDRLLSIHDEAAVAQEAKRRLELMAYLDGLVKVVGDSSLAGKGLAGTYAKL